MTFASLVLAALAVLPSDRMGMADRLFDRGAYREARGEYEIMRSEIDLSCGQKNFTVQITDPALIEKTGGIVQGMSGSPIIQDGAIIGAVTHVMVGDPTRGYGIFIENMLTQMALAG